VEAAAVGIGEFREGGALESGADVGEQLMAGMEPPVQSGAVAAFGETSMAVVVAVRQKAVVDGQLQPVQTSAQGPGPVLIQWQGGLGEQSGGGGVLLLVGGAALACAAGTDLITVTIILLPVHFGADHVVELSGLAGMAQAGAVKLPLIAQLAAARKG